MFLYSRNSLHASLLPVSSSANYSIFPLMEGPLSVAVIHSSGRRVAERMSYLPFMDKPGWWLGSSRIEMEKFYLLLLAEGGIGILRQRRLLAGWLARNTTVFQANHFFGMQNTNKWVLIEAERKLLMEWWKLLRLSGWGLSAPYSYYESMGWLVEGWGIWMWHVDEKGS